MTPILGIALERAIWTLCIAVIVVIVARKFLYGQPKLPSNEPKGTGKTSR